MTEQNYEDAIAELGRTDGMDAETVAALERRLLQAFTDHHSTRVTAGTNDVRPERTRNFRQPRVAALGCGRGSVRPPRGRNGGMAGASPDGTRTGGTSGGPGSGASSGCARRDDRDTRPAAVPPKRAPRARPARRVVRPAAFVALPGTAGLPEFESGTIVRLELSLASLPSYGVDITRAGTDRPVEADVLVGQDGQPRAIRLVSSGNARALRSQ